MELFTSDDPNKVESGEYTLGKATSNVETGFQIDVVTDSDVIIDELTGNTTNEYIVSGETRVVDLTASPILTV